MKKQQNIQYTLKKGSSPIKSQLSQFMSVPNNPGYIEIQMKQQYLKDLKKIQIWQVPQLALCTKFKMGTPLLQSISDINFQRMFVLDISMSLIESLQRLSTLNAPALKRLFLGQSPILNIQPLKKLMSFNLQTLAIDQTKILEASCLTQGSFWERLHEFNLQYMLESEVTLQDYRFLIKLVNKLKHRIQIANCSSSRIKKDLFKQKMKKKFPLHIVQM